MHWTFRYLARHAAQKALGAAPSGYRVQEWVKSTTRGGERFLAGEFIRKRARIKIERFNAAGIEPPGVVVEQGTGALGLDLALFHLAGTRRVFTYDTTPWLRPDHLERQVEVLAAAPEIVKGWRGSDPEGVEERAAVLREAPRASRETLPERLGAAVRVTRSMDRGGIAPASVDLFYSDSVLQFVDPRDLTALVRQARHFLRPAGSCFHVVDCRDSHAHRDPRIPPLAYLRWPEPLWNLLTSRYLNYQNRWRMPEFVTLFEREGFSVRALNPLVAAEDREYARRRLTRAARFRGMSVPEIATSQFVLTGVPA